MIVSERFEGDKTDFQWAQHDQYGKAIGIILGGCRKHYLAQFEHDPENEIVPALKNLHSFDHRVLQDFHDHIAAYWRKKYFHSGKSVHESVNEWLFWLEKEMHNLRTKSQVYVGVCFLALDRYDKDHEKRVIGFLQSYAQKKYPLKWQHYMQRVSLEGTLNTICAASVLIFAVIGLYSGIAFYKEMPSMAIILGLLFAIGYIFVNNQKLHEVCMKNVFVFIIRILLIFLCAFGIALLITGLNNFQSNLLLNHLTEIAIFMTCVIGMHILVQLYVRA